MAILKKFIITILPLFLCGCYSDFEPKIDVTPVLCLNSLIKAGEPINVSVTHTWLYTDEDSYENHDVPDAIVKIYANGILKDSDYIPKEGDMIRITAESDTYGFAEAEVKVPDPVIIKSIQWHPVLTDLSINKMDENRNYINIKFDLKVEFEVTEQSAEDDFYILHYFTCAPTPEDYYPQTDSDIDTKPNVWNLIGVVQSNAEKLFTDVIHKSNFSYWDGSGNFIMGGKQYQDNKFTLITNYSDCRYLASFIEWDNELMDCGYLFSLQRISKSLMDLARYESYYLDFGFGDLTEIGLADPIRGYSNVSTGAGVVAAETSTDFSISIKDFLKETLTEIITK
ncbi:MAG: DUF4249 domain-containing protein [Muribaculaceae bacterium]|nr:DUF4249 domain-containing protein [Muribaculaceae bacterium]